MPPPEDLLPADANALQDVLYIWVLDSAVKVFVYDPVSNTVIPEEPYVIGRGDFVDLTVSVEITSSRSAEYGKVISVGFALQSITKLTVAKTKVCL